MYPKMRARLTAPFLSTRMPFVILTMVAFVAALIERVF
jgi:hypothetical protein